MSGRSSGSSWSGVRATARATGRMSKIEKVKPWPASLPVEMGKVGLDLCAPFSTKWYNDYVAEAHLKLGLLEKFGRSEGALAYVLGSSKALWERFLRHTKPRSAFPDHPRSSAGATAFEAFLMEVVAEALIKARPDETMRHRVYLARPLDAGKEAIAVQRCAGLAGLCDAAPLTKLCVHPTFGPWIALRAVVVFDADGPPQKPHPVTATLSPAELDTAQTYIEKAEGNPGDYESWLKVREAFTRGDAYRFSDSQMLYCFAGPQREKNLAKALQLQLV